MDLTLTTGGVERVPGYQRRGVIGTPIFGFDCGRQPSDERCLRLRNRDRSSTIAVVRALVNELFVA